MTTDLLDQDELMHLALRDISSGAHESAIEKLKKALTVTPDDPRLQFLLAAEHAEIGMLDRAKEGLHTTLQLDAKLHPARFQLGLLELMSGNGTAAEEIWQGLEELGPENGMVLYSQALLIAQTEDKDQAIALLKKAIEVETDNPSLRREMEKSLELLRNAPSPASGQSTQDGTRTVGDSSDLLKRYESSDTTPASKKKH